MVTPSEKEFNSVEANLSLGLSNKQANNPYNQYALFQLESAFTRFADLAKFLGGGPPEIEVDAVTWCLCERSVTRWNQSVVVQNGDTLMIGGCRVRKGPPA